MRQQTEEQPFFGMCPCYCGSGPQEPVVLGSTLKGSLFWRAQNERLREQEERARAAASEREAAQRLIRQLPRPVMAARGETSITLTMRRLAADAVRVKPAPLPLADCDQCGAIACMW
jgi:hypothetical protein